MTTVRMSTTRAASAAKHDCGCGCGGTGGSCCDLECLVRPNFYCGQLLTDADLSAVVQWTRDRLSLSRYRDGWGVVCGLEVTCTEPEGACGCGCGSPKGCTVWIDKGYAVDCCGNDLVVCEPIPVDLGCVCRPDDDPCADPCWPPVPKDQQKMVRTAGPPDIKHGDLTIPGDEQMIVDLYLKYGEQRASGQRALFRGSCADMDSCEPSRLLERPVPKLVARQLASPYEDDQSEEEQVKRLIQLYLDQIKRIDALFENADLSTLIRRLAKWRLHSVCLVMEYVRAEYAAGQKDVASVIRAKVRSWLLLDWITHEALCQCPPCRTDEGVRLARLWLWRKAGRVECCRPLAIFGTPPIRRELQRDCPPAFTSKVDLRRWLGARANSDTIDKMEREGIRIQDAADLSKREPRDPVFAIAPSRSVSLVTVTDGLSVDRIVGFENASNK